MESNPGALTAAEVPLNSTSRRTLVAAFVAAVLSVTPTFLLGSVAVLVRADLGSRSRGWGCA